MKILEDTPIRLGLYHLFYWMLFVTFFTLVWGSYDSNYYRNFMAQIFSLPSRLLLVYITLLVLFPMFFNKEKIRWFIISYVALLLACTGLVQRPIMLFIVEGRFLPFHSTDFFKLSEFTNTMIDVNLAAIIPVGSKMWGYWSKSRNKIEELQILNQKLNKSKNQFILFKKGSRNHKIFLEEIIFIESLKNNIIVTTPKKKHNFYGSISNMEAVLKDKPFIRIHRSFIVNLNCIETFTTTNVVVNGYTLPMGRKYKSEVLKKLKIRE